MTATRVLVTYTDTSGRDMAFELYPEGEGDFVRVEPDDRGGVVISANCAMKNLSPGVIP